MWFSVDACVESRVKLSFAEQDFQTLFCISADRRICLRRFQLILSYSRAYDSILQHARDCFYRATLCVSSVLAVARCLSVLVTLVDCIHTAEDIVKLLVRPGSKT